MQIGIVTDEISADVREAIQLGTGWGIRHYELRVIADARVPSVKAETVDELLRLKENLGISYTALSPGTGKGSIDDHEKLAQELNEILPATFVLAKKLDVPKVIISVFNGCHTNRTHWRLRRLRLFAVLPRWQKRRDVCW
jgi:sugar phosphate isomerase/epimerase